MAKAVASRRNTRIDQEPHRLAEQIPAISVVLASSLAILPIVSSTGWWPDMGLLMMIAWRLQRADAWPAWWAAPLGFVNDLLSGHPLGLSVALWSAIMIAMDLIDRRTEWRDYWIEWAIALLFIMLCETAQWQVAAVMGAPLPFGLGAAPAIIVGVLTFPLVARLVSAIDRWRLRR